MVQRALRVALVGERVGERTLCMRVHIACVARRAKCPEYERLCERLRREFRSRLALMVACRSGVVAHGRLSLAVSGSGLPDRGRPSASPAAPGSRSRAFRAARVCCVLNTLLALPSVVVGLVVYLLLSRSGPLGAWGILFTPTAMVIAQTILVLPVVAALSRQLVADGLRDGGDQLRSLGAGPLPARC